MNTILNKVAVKSGVSFKMFGRRTAPTLTHFFYLPPPTLNINFNKLRLTFQVSSGSSLFSYQCRPLLIYLMGLTKNVTKDAPTSNSRTFFQFLLYPLSFLLSLHQEFCRKLQGASKNVFGRRGVKIKTASSTFN